MYISIWAGYLNFREGPEAPGKRQTIAKLLLVISSQLYKEQYNDATLTTSYINAYVVVMSTHSGADRVEKQKKQ